MSSSMDVKIDSKSVEAGEAGLPEELSSSSFGEENKTSRTPIDYSSFPAFGTTLVSAVFLFSTNREERREGRAEGSFLKKKWR